MTCIILWLKYYRLLSVITYKYHYYTYWLTLRGQTFSFVFHTQYSIVILCPRWPVLVNSVVCLSRKIIFLSFLDDYISWVSNNIIMSIIKRVVPSSLPLCRNKFRHAHYIIYIGFFFIYFNLVLVTFFE